MTNDTLITQQTLAADLATLGVKAGMTLMVHSSLKALGGFLLGGAVSVILALEQVLTESGTLVMPTHTGDLSEPSHWQRPPIPESWWQSARDHMPAYDRDLSPSYGMGIIPETFRKQAGVLRSDHPQVSFAAWGKHAAQITQHHALSPMLGESSPLSQVYALDGWVLLLGVDHYRNTSLHLAEARAKIDLLPHRTGSPVMRDGVRQWIAWDDFDWNNDDFIALGNAFAHETGRQRQGKIANATALLMPQRALVDYGVTWLEHHRATSPDV